VGAENAEIFAAKSKAVQSDIRMLFVLANCHRAIEKTHDIERLLWKSRCNKIAFMDGKSAAHSGLLCSQMKGFVAKPAFE
jgi:hypothetical protein